MQIINHHQYYCYVDYKYIYRKCMSETNNYYYVSCMVCSYSCSLTVNK